MYLYEKYSELRGKGVINMYIYFYTHEYNILNVYK